MAELERRVAEKIAEVQADIQKLTQPRFRKLENWKKLEKMLSKEVELLTNNAVKNLENHLTTCNYAFYKSIISEIENMENVTAVLKVFKRNEMTVTVDIVQKEPNVWLKLVNRPAKTLLIEYRDGKRNGDVIGQLKQQRFVSRQFNNPQIHVIFKKGILKEMADKLVRKGVIVEGELIEKEELKGKWNEELIERLAEEEDSDWGEEDEEDDDDEEEEQEGLPSASLPRINLDISAVMLLVSNMCEPGGANFRFVEPMINNHVARERENPAKAALWQQLNGHQLIMSKIAFDRVSEIVLYIGGPNEKQRFAELSEQIVQIPDEETDEVGRVAQLNGIRGITSVTKYVFSCSEKTKTTTVTANKAFLTHARAKGVYFKVIEIPPRPLTEEKQAHATPL